MTELGLVATDAECCKQLKCEAISQCFTPVAVETLGALGEEVTAFLTVENNFFARTAGHMNVRCAQHLRNDFVVKGAFQMN